MFSIITMLTKPQALKALKVSPRTLARYVTQGRLRASYQVTKRGREARFDEDQVRKLKAAIAAERAVIYTPAPIGAPSVALEKRNHGLRRGQEFDRERLEARNAPVGVLGERAWITRQQAVELAGLPPGVVYAAIAGELEASGDAVLFPGNGGWRIKRSALLAWSEGFRRR